MIVSPTRNRTAIPAALESGARLTQRQFHKLYRRTPDGFKAELVDGVVYVASPVHIAHGRTHYALTKILGDYDDHTRGIQGSLDTTVVLGKKDEPQPDLFLRILPKFGGQTRIRKHVVFGAPEFVFEVANSSYALDLGAKRERYAAAGVREYIVADVGGQRLHGFDFVNGAEYGPDVDDILRPRHVAGLWLHCNALFERKTKLLRRTLLEGLQSPEHAAFVEKLMKTYRDRPKPAE
jgi:Uma2 family endonuclease